jgi:hypothetical protein
MLLCQTPGDELKWVRNAAEEDTVALASRRGMVVCIACNNDKVQCSFCNLCSQFVNSVSMKFHCLNSSNFVVQ